MRNRMLTAASLLALVAGCNSPPQCTRGLEYYAPSDSCLCPGGAVPLLDAMGRELLHPDGRFMCPSPSDAGMRDAGRPDAGALDAGSPDDAARPDAPTCESTGTLEHCTACGDRCAWSCTPSGCNDPVVVSVGARHACAARSTSGVVCWGDNDSGQLGDGTFGGAASAPVPTLLAGRATAVGAGGYGILGTSYSCALLSTGLVSCWGGIDWESRPRKDRSIPGGVVLPDRATAINAGISGACATLLDGSLWCWGDAPLPDGGATSPAEVDASGRVGAAAIGFGFGCLIDEEGLACWGANHAGQLGQGNTMETRGLRRLALSGPRLVAAGWNTACSSDAAGFVHCWGGRFGTVPSLIDGVRSPVALAVGMDTACAIVSGAVHCWGARLGADGDYAGVEAIAGVEGVVDAISVGQQFACAVGSAGAWCWGAGALGDRMTTTSVAAVRVSAPLE